MRLGLLLGGFLREEFPQLADGVVHDEAHIADGEAGDVGDFLVGAVVEKLEADDLALVRPQAVHAAPDMLVKLAIDGDLAGIRFMRGRGLKEFVLAEIEPVVLPQDVEGTIPADGVEPGLEIVPHAGWLGEVELEKRILHDIAATLDVSTEDAGCVGDEVAFMLVEGTPDQDRGFILVGAFWHACKGRGGTGGRWPKLGSRGHFAGDFSLRKGQRTRRVPVPCPAMTAPSTLRVRLSALLGLLAIILGSMGAHGSVHDMLVGANELDHWKTASFYHLTHAVLAALLALLAGRGGKAASWAWRFTVAGIFLFSGSLYVLAYTQVKWLGAVTPFGGLSFMLGWICLAVAKWRE